MSPLQGRDHDTASRAAALTEPDFQFFPNVLLWHGFAKSLYQEPNALVLWQAVGVGSHTLAWVDQPHKLFTDHEVVSNVKYKDEHVS
jgi:hypothetical protein